MFFSRKKVQYLQTLVSNDLISGMHRYKIVEELERLGILIDPNVPLDKDILSQIYSLTAQYLIDKYQRKEGGEAGAPAIQ